LNPTRAALLQDATDRQSGEDVLVEPMTTGSAGVNGRPVADGARPAKTITAIWSEPFTEYARRPHERAQSHDRDVPSSRPHFKFQTGLLPYSLVIGDRVTRVATGERYAAQSIGADGFGRAMIGLTARSG
jgi:hypothetical protein